MRHGERIDNIDIKKQILPKEDPELTQKVISQASSIGKKLKENYFKDF
jgi:broad specificity phosphatase PhoE